MAPQPWGWSDIAGLVRGATAWVDRVDAVQEVATNQQAQLVLVLKLAAKLAVRLGAQRAPFLQLAAVCYDEIHGPPPPSPSPR